MSDRIIVILLAWAAFVTVAMLFIRRMGIVQDAPDEPPPAPLPRAPTPPTDSG